MGFWFDSFFADLAVCAVFLIFCIYRYTSRKFSHWTNSNIVQLEPSFPYGNTRAIILNKETFGITFEKIYNELKKKDVIYGGYYFMLRPELMIIDPEIVKQILVKDFQHFVDRGMFSDEENDPLTGNLFVLNGTKWKNLRAKLTPTFTSGKMKMMFHTVVSCGDELKKIVEEKQLLGEPIDVKEYLARFTTDVIGSCAFGIDCNCLRNPNADFRKYGLLIIAPQGIDLVKQVAGTLMPGVLKKLKMPVTNKGVTDFFIGAVKETIECRRKNNETKKDFIQLLLDLKSPIALDKNITSDHEATSDEDLLKNRNSSESVSGLTIDQIAAQCFVFFLAGFETSSTTMTFCLYELVRNPAMQEKLRNEINTVLEKHDRKLTYEAIMDMPYMDKIINETLRKYPPLPFLYRQCTKDYPLPNSTHIIRKGEIVNISILGLQRDPEYYPDPLKFDPERFNDEEVAKRHPFTFLPFGDGPRVCIGTRFGLMQSKIGLIVLLKNYSFTMNSKTQEPLVMDPNSFMILSALGGIWLDAHKVKS